MNKSRITFLTAELLLAVLVVFFVKNIFAGEKPQKRVAVIVENSGDEKWDSFINGMKQAASLRNIHLVICNTDEIENAKEEKSLILEQMDNDADAFIIQAAPGYDVMYMLEEISRTKPVVLVENDALSEKIDADIHAKSGLPAIMPDSYEMGYNLGMELLRKNENEISGKTIGIVSGIEETDSAKKRQQGFKDAIADSGCKISWQINTKYEMGISTVIEHKSDVDFIAVLETGALEELGKMKADGELQSVELYGIGSSIKCVYYLDTEIIESLVIAAGYDMGFDSVVEISRMLENGIYNASDHVTGMKVLHKEDIFTEENQEFLYTYE